MATVAVGAHGDVGITQDGHLSVVSLVVARLRIGMAGATGLVDGKARCRGVCRGNRMRRVTVGADRRIDIACACYLLAMGGTEVIAQLRRVATSADLGRLLAPLGRGQSRVCVRDRGNVGVATGTLEITVHARGEMIGRHEQRACLPVGELGRKTRLAVATQTGHVTEIGVLRSRGLNSREQDQRSGHRLQKWLHRHARPASQRQQDYCRVRRTSSTEAA